MYVLYSVEFN